MADAQSFPDPIRVLIVAEDPLAREGLSSRIAREQGLLEAGRCAGEIAVGRAAESRADVALWDLHAESPQEAPGFLEAVRALPVVALISGSSQAREALSGGARGALWREAEPACLAPALSAAAAGLLVLDETAASTALHFRSDAEEPPLEALTPREQEVLEMLSLGSTNREIAKRLGISEHTAKFHVNAILSKLDAGSRTEAVVKAARLGLVVL